MHAWREDGIPIIVLASKADLEAERQVELDQGESFASSVGLRHFAMSAKTNKNLHDALADLAQQCETVAETRAAELQKLDARARQAQAEVPQG